MAFQTDKKRFTGALSDINVTPLVDVTLVLLIIFMIAAPVVLQGLETDLPRAMVSDVELESDQVVVTVTAERAVFINQEPVNRDSFVDQLRENLAAAGRHYVYLRADKSLSYGDVVRVIELIKESGVPNIGLVTEQGIEEEQ
ncbi:MAG TPA: biopolymer transporter ExbD [Acidobacteriota bacterium]|nr:biopolymer transporter ExbD [Acidobacteriota bacterium]